MRVVTAAVAVALAASCAPSSRGATPSAPAPSPDVLERAARADSVRAHYTDADVAFMRDMIHHHAQALVMARMAPTHGASEPLETLAARIINSQNDEIALMQRWLRERGERVPAVSEEGHVTPADGAAAPDGHSGHPVMAGMLTPDQLARLDAAGGEEWDRLFLRFMIQHHQGAVDMVDELFSTHGAGQGDDVFRIAAAIGADQASEIDRMQRMLQDRIFGNGGPP